jgi:uncharacterized membrane protein YkvA (DUF1232 family)
MTEKPKRDNVPPQRNLNFFRQFIEQLRLSWALFTDSRVPVMTKLIPLIAIAYVISPIDLVPDLIPVLGQLDDLGILMTSLTMFNNMAPADVVAEHMTRFREGNPYKVKRSDEGVTIDVKPRQRTPEDNR